MITIYVAMTLLLLPGVPQKGIVSYKDFDTVEAACQATVGDLIAEVTIIPFSIKECCAKRGGYENACNSDPYTYDCDFGTSHKTKTLRCYSSSQGYFTQEVTQ